MVEDRLISLKKKREKLSHLYYRENWSQTVFHRTVAVIQHISDFFLINAIKSPEIMGKWKFKHKLKWKKLFFLKIENEKKSKQSHIPSHIPIRYSNE